MKTVQFSPAARADLARLDPPVRARVLAAIERYAAEAAGKVKRLKADPPEFRLRVGDWRVRFELLTPALLYITRVRHRSAVYK